MVCAMLTIAAVLFPNFGRVAGKFMNRRVSTLESLGISVSGLHGERDLQGVVIFKVFFQQQFALDRFVS